MKRNPEKSRKFERCVKAVSKRGKVDDPKAVCAVRKRKRNPVEDAADLSEAFHGRPAKRVTKHSDTVHTHAVLADLGEMIRLCVETLDGRRKDIEFDGKTRLGCSEDGRQLYFVDGDQSIDPSDFGVKSQHDSVVLGQAFGIAYFTNKEHLGAEGGTATYEHEFEKPYPVVIYDCLNDEISLSGGGYLIEKDIDGKYSAGIKG